MAKKPRFGPTRKLTEMEMSTAIAASIANLRKLVEIYEDGHYAISGLMAVEIRKIVSEHAGSIKLRGGKTFRSYVEPPNPKVISAVHELVVAQAGGDPPVVEFKAMASGPKPPFAAREVDFKTWWNREVVYRASAAIPGAAAKGMIPVNDSPSTPFEEREKLSRMDLIDLVRNKVGAHTEVELPELIDDLESGIDFATIGFHMPDGSTIDTASGTLPVRVGILSASVHQISLELLEAYS